MTADTRDLFAGLGCLQFRIEPGEPEKNFTQVAEGLASADSLKGSLIVLPELWSSGFAYDCLGEMADATAGVLEKLAGQARLHGCTIAGSLLERAGAGAGGRFYNTLYITAADGVIGCYRKQQIFLYGGEGQAFEPGFEPYPVATPQGMLGCLVCYDLRFPDLARIQCQMGADLLLCSAQWPQARIEHWRILLQARAIENQTFLVACNGCGSVDGVELGGASAIIDPLGRILAAAVDGDDPQLVMLRPDWQQREEFRSRFRSYAVSTYPFKNEGKIMQTAASCIELLRRRKESGQRLVCCEISRPISTEGLQALEDARRKGDFLLLLLSSEIQSDSDRRFSAALGCVDAVCSREGWSKEDRLRLGELAVRVEIAG